MKHLIHIVAIGVLTACGSGSNPSAGEERYTNQAQGYSVDQPVGWNPSIVRGFAQFAPKQETTRSAQNQNHTIVVRAGLIRRELKEGKPTTNDDVAAATENVLRELPRAQIGARTQLQGAVLPGVRFSMTFVPPGRTARYRREHALLFGTQRKVFHVIYTAPAGEQIDEQAFKTMVTTLGEEG